MTAHPDEHNCSCHWGSAEDLARLKTPDVELDPDLLRRSWEPTDWDDHASVLRRILPQLASALVSGQVAPLFGMYEVGRSLARGNWQQWPAEQAAAVRAFLHAWWTHSLITPNTAVPAYEVLALCAEASATLAPWLDIWETSTDPVADQRLTEAIAHWESDLLEDQLPWETWNIEEDLLSTLTAWLIRHAPARLRAHGTPRQADSIPQPVLWTPAASAARRSPGRFSPLPAATPRVSNTSGTEPGRSGTAPPRHR
ncbi:hypothetical protein [Nonomuraea cavernae]|uniref:hypothetical protein n=1 Tax=Nonomuraea cavernae TaxID=2045107 RepID=UPI0033E57EA4